jgi:phage shock protein PspC (stress-responsive transcriptional regulator)
MDTQDPTQPPPPHGQSQAPRPPRRVRRDTTEGMIGGVAAGLARHLEVDVVWVRLAFVLTAIFGNGLGLVAYLAAWIIIPEGDDRDAGASSSAARSGGPLSSVASNVPDGARGARFWVGVGLIGIGGLVLLDRLLSPLQARLGWVSPSQLLVPLAIITIGVLLWRSSRGDLAFDSERIEQDIERFAERVERGAETAAEQIERWVDEGGAVKDARSGSRGATSSQSGRASSHDTRVTPATLGVALVAAGAVWLLSSLGVSGATLTRALAAALLVVGVGLVISAFIGRGRGLIGTGLLLAPIVLIATLAGPSHVAMRSLGVTDDGIMAMDPDARVEERPGNLAEVASTYTFGVGSIVLDLSGLDAAELATAGTTRIGVELGVGDLLILLPEGVTAVVSANVGIGQVDLAGRSSGGIGVSATRTLTGTSDDTGTIVLDAELGIGRVRVTR